jgi:hypothetical protein
MEIVNRKRVKPNRAKRVYQVRKFVVNAFGARKYNEVLLLTQTGDALVHITEEGRAIAYDNRRGAAKKL